MFAYLKSVFTWQCNLFFFVTVKTKRIKCLILFSLLQNYFRFYPHPPCNATWLISCLQDNFFPSLLSAYCKQWENQKTSWERGIPMQMQTHDSLHHHSIYILKIQKHFSYCQFKSKVGGKQSSTARAVHHLQGGRVDHHLEASNCNLHTIQKL